MKHGFLLLLAIGVLTGLSGCSSTQGQLATDNGQYGGCAEDYAACDTCGEAGHQTQAKANAGLGGLFGAYEDECGGAGCRLPRRMAVQGPPTGAITYPYYTNRGPRDFLAQNPRSIGP